MQSGKNWGKLLSLVFLVALSFILTACNSSQNDAIEENKTIGTSATANGIQLNVIEILLGGDAVNYIVKRLDSNMLDKYMGVNSPYRPPNGWRNAIVRLSAKNITPNTIYIGTGSICGYVTDSGGYRRELVRERVQVRPELLPPDISEVEGWDVAFFIPNNQTPASMYLTPCNGGASWIFSDLTSPIQPREQPTELVTIEDATLTYENAGNYSIVLDNFQISEQEGHYDDWWIRINSQIRIENTGGYDLDLRKGPLILITNNLGCSDLSSTIIWPESGNGITQIPPGTTLSGIFHPVLECSRKTNDEAPSWINLALVHSKDNLNPVVQFTIGLPKELPKE